jgi:hypothetical protein
MLASINPLGERGRGNRYWITVTAYSIGSVLGGLAAGAFVGAVGAALSSMAAIDVERLAWLVAALAITAFVVEVGGVRVPSMHRQVDESWLGVYRGWVYGLGFGVQLGLGVTTVVTTASLYVVFIVAAMSGSFTVGILIGATFGLVRALPILTTADARDPSRLRLRLARFSAGARRARLATAVAVAGLALTAVVTSAAGGAAWPT